MNDDTIKNQIEGLVAASPSATEQNALKPIEAPQQPVGYSTLRVGLPDQM